MSKLKSQKSVKKTDEVPEIEPATPEKEVEEVKKVPEIDEEEDEEDNEDENGEEPVVKNVEDPKPKEATSEQRAEEIQILQNDGIYRVETLYQLGALNKNIVDLNTLIAGVIEKK